MKKDIFGTYLPKWPAFIVKGKPVTKNQAKEIIIRTDNFRFCSNDREFEKDIHEIIYGERSTWGEIIEMPGYFEKKESKRKELRVLELEYLHNSQIMSSYIGGPHGWCNWNGYIGCNTYNIGKYPAAEQVFNEWTTIANAFPFLDLKCQLFNGEAGEEEIYPVIEYIVKDGTVDAVAPVEPIDFPNINTERDVMYMLFNPQRERGCTKEQIKDALDIISGKIK